ncbi:MAG TPA: ComEC/Rec2 family competence protein [Candidatus Dojkabacteria bacterium]|nr:ComEC/Rec2 family competence protein [Candidatus Dojkabacteria bacterium]
MKARFVYFFDSILRYPLVALAFLTTIYLVVLESLNIISAIVFIIICGLLLLIKKYKVHVFLLILVIIFVSVSFQIKVLENNPVLNGLPEFSKHQQRVIVTGIVQNYPYNKKNFLIVLLQPVSINSRNSEAFPGLIQVQLPRFAQVQKGDLLKITGTWQIPESINGFNYKAYLQVFDIYALVINVSQFQVLENRQGILLQKINLFRFRMVKETRKLLPEPHASLLLGMLIGTKEDFPGSFNRNLQISGTTHIIAVSGFNVTIIAQFLLGFAGMLPRKLIFLLVSVVLGIFLLIVGVDNIPALRATVMAWATIFGQLTGRKGVVLNLLALAYLLMLLSNPQIYKSLSLQLSFAATLGLIFISDRLLIFIKRFLPELLAADLSVTLSAILATFPVTFSKFGGIYIWAPIANLLVAPSIPVIMLAGFLLVLTELINTGLAKIIALFCYGLLNLMVSIINGISSLPLADIKITNNLGLISFIFSLILLLIIAEGNFRDSSRLKNLKNRVGNLL